LAIQKNVREGDLVVRYGGDEFVALFPDKGTRLETFQGRLKRHLKTFHIAGSGIPLRVSLGMARFPADGEDLDALFAVADARMYADKKRWGNR
jgi:diguanylate cyclase (GGDEF)-like protein